MPQRSTPTSARCSPRPACPSGALADRLRDLEVRFSVERPSGEHIVREIVDSLAKMGI
jgi:hypothetical protein